MSATAPTLLTTGQAAAMFGVTTSTIKRWADAGDLPHTRTLGGHLRFNRADLERIAARNDVPKAS